MLPPLRDTKIVDVRNENVFDWILNSKRHGWTLAREKKISQTVMRLVFERIHVDKPKINSLDINRAFRDIIQIRPIPRDHYEVHGIYSDDIKEYVWK